MDNSNVRLWTTPTSGYGQSATHSQTVKYWPTGALAPVCASRGFGIVGLSYLPSVLAENGMVQLLRVRHQLGHLVIAFAEPNRQRGRRLPTCRRAACWARPSSDAATAAASGAAPFLGRAT